MDKYTLRLAMLTAAGILGWAGQVNSAGIQDIATVVVIYAENRSFDNLYGSFPGANGLAQATPTASTQLDRDGAVLKELPPIWGGLTAKGVVPAVTQAMQIDGGKNDRFVAYADSGALVMGDYDGSKLPLWPVAKQYTLADNFFMGSFGGSFLAHFWLICSCTPSYPNADTSPAKGSISAVGSDGGALIIAANSPKSAIEGIPKFVKDGNLTPDFYAVNTMQPPYQPSANKPAPDGDPAFADPAAPTTLPPQTQQTIGDLLTAKGISWAWYAGAWQVALDGKNAVPVPNFQYHHQPFNYFADMAPGTAARAEHLKDGGLGGSEFIKAIDAGTLPQVTFYKPQGNLNEHAGYTDVLEGDRHIADVIAHLQKRPQWAHMLVVVTYDENGGFWDHVAPPKGDRWGPGSRIPALIVSPLAKQGFVDHTFYDTTSILRFITRRFALPALAGLQARDAALAAHGSPPLGDLTAALDPAK
jgi:acid phosphatase